jgi:ubiquinone biosynthesis protein UbiJ
MQAFIHQSLEAAINRYLSLDPESHARLLALDDKLITIELLAVSYTLPLKIAGGRIVILSEPPEKPDVVIRGTPLSLLHMSLSEDRKQFFADDVQIEGNLELGQQIIDLFDEMEIDWEEHTSRVIGDIPAHQVGRFIKEAKAMIQRAKDSLTQNINEYVHEEKLIFPPKEALYDFFNDIDLLRMDADRLEARVMRLKKLSGDFQ